MPETRSREDASYVLAHFGIDDFLDEAEQLELVRRLRARDLNLDVYRR